MRIYWSDCRKTQLDGAALRDVCHAPNGPCAGWDPWSTRLGFEAAHNPAVSSTSTALLWRFKVFSCASWPRPQPCTCAQAWRQRLWRVGTGPAGGSCGLHEHVLDRGASPGQVDRMISGRSTDKKSAGCQDRAGRIKIAPQKKKKKRKRSPWSVLCLSDQISQSLRLRMYHGYSKPHHTHNTHTTQHNTTQPTSKHSLTFTRALPPKGRKGKTPRRNPYSQS